MEKCPVSLVIAHSWAFSWGKMWRNGKSSPPSSHKIAGGFLYSEAGFPLKEGFFHQRGVRG